MGQLPHSTDCDTRVGISAARGMGDFPKQAQMPLRGSGGDENGRLTFQARLTSCSASAIF